jgi:hypothetical protein
MSKREERWQKCAGMEGGQEGVIFSRPFVARIRLDPERSASRGLPPDRSRETPGVR